MLRSEISFPFPSFCNQVAIPKDLPLILEHSTFVDATPRDLLFNFLKFYHHCPRIFPALWKIWVVYCLPHCFDYPGPALRHNKIVRIQPPSFRKTQFFRVFFPANHVFSRFKICHTTLAAQSRPQPREPLEWPQVAASSRKWAFRIPSQWLQVAAFRDFSFLKPTPDIFLFFPQTVYCWGSHFFLKEVSGFVQVVVLGPLGVQKSFVSVCRNLFISRSGWWCPALRLSLLFAVTCFPSCFSQHLSPDLYICLIIYLSSIISLPKRWCLILLPVRLCACLPSFVSDHVSPTSWVFPFICSPTGGVLFLFQHAFVCD